ncbi:hypothetical protein ABEB36_015697 [Hypothenemus hampei]|uniref:CCHC-type domain-containing protein n=1 Tax=Hypothenemus hampei TaxID=57062 RepID=A0ABD1DZ21_HYPHA
MSNSNCFAATDSGGVGTPRSGNVGGGQAGPPRSSSDYRGSPGLSDQVPGSMVTGKQEEVVGFASDREANLQWLIDPFSPGKDGEQRRDSTRSLDKTINPNMGRQSCIEAGPFVPPHMGGETAKEDLERFHSINSDANENSEDLHNITLISSEEEEIEQGNKRLRDETSPLAQTKKKPKGEETSNKISRMDTTVQQMCKQIDLLDKIVQGSHRPKQELKIVTNTLTSIAAALRKEDLGNVLKELDEISRLQEENRVLRSEIKELKDLKNKEKKILTSTVTQTDTSNAKNYIETLPKIDTYLDFIKVATCEWDESAYTNTELQEGNIIKTKDDTTIATIVNKNDTNSENTMYKELAARYPELEEINDDIGILEQVSRIQNNETEKDNYQKIMKIIYNGNEEELYNKMGKLKKLTNETEWIAVSCGENYDGIKLRKITEAIFHGSDTQVMDYATNKKGKTTYKQKERNTYAIEDDGQGQSFSEVLKKIKENVSKTNSNNIKGIRSTKENKLLITLEKDKQKMEDVQNDILKIKGSRGLQKYAVHIRGMDKLCTVDEVREALEELVPGIGPHLKLSELRPFRNDRQAITVNTDKTHIDKITIHNELRIGFNTCYIEREHFVVKCRKCWASGHVERECRGQDRRDRCYKCGEKGHNAKQCSGVEKCPLCLEEGHRAGSGRCRDFRRNLSMARREENMRRRASTIASVPETPKIKVGQNIVIRPPVLTNVSNQSSQQS